jgi:3-oxoadipate enol-lactonase
MTAAETTGQLHHRLEGPEDAPVFVLGRWFTPAFRANRPEAFEWAGRMLRETPAEGYAGCCEAIRDADLRDRLGAIRAPTLVVAGAEDPAAPPEQADLMTRSIPDARFVVIEQAAHLANVERPGEVTRAVLDHLGPVSRKGE